MKIIGLTGGIGSGKTILAKEFSKNYIQVYNSDERAKFLMNNSKDLKDSLIKCFGSNTYVDDSLNKTYLSSLIFNDRKSLELMNSIVHPQVEKDFMGWMKTKDEKYVIYESALIFETGSYKRNDFNILVTSDLSVRINRIMNRDKIDKSLAMLKINNQWKDEKKIPLADYIFVNSTIDENIQTVKKLVTYFNSIYK
ncbi:MAG: dephospho-CoA kinase [Flavobacteriaceae bacterium]|jgi:dephospho-CoA kinase|tara:strand:- start:683 stop:1270 length:588 start_codon:yes stop_codon:yes gene_type:complete